MSVSARTYQLLYIIRQRALKDQDTMLNHFAEFIAVRRKDAPLLYERAYISPTAIVDLLHRMSTSEGLLVVVDGLYEFTPLGSQMADLVTDIDACTTKFIDEYKEQVVLAVLKQRARLRQGAATQREIASVANISLDSTRRGLQALIDTNVVIESQDGRSTTYTLKDLPLAVPSIPAHPDEQEANPILEALAGLCADEDTINIRPPVEEPDPEDLPLSVSAILGDTDPDPTTIQKEPDPEANPKPNPPDFLKLPETTAVRRFCAMIQAAIEDLESKLSTYTNESEDYPLPPPPPLGISPEASQRLDAAIDDLLNEGDECDEPADSDPYAWHAVPFKVQQEHVLLAKSMDLTLRDYFTQLASMNKMRARRGLLGLDENLLRSLLLKHLAPPPYQKKR